jgi:hypothetical protein
MAFESLDELLRCFRDHGATRVVAKQLAENDNSTYFRQLTLRKPAAS